MNKSFDIAKIQKAIKDEGFDGWLFYDFRGSDPLGLKILNFSHDMLRTRRWFYLVPAKGEPVKLCHKIEATSLDHLPGNDKRIYLSWQELETGLKSMLKGIKNLAMQYSKDNAIPYVSKIDAGTFELLTSFGIKIHTSANLVQAFEAVLSKQELKSHLEAGKSLRKIFDRAFGEIARAIKAKEKTDEYKIQQFICEEFKKENLQIEELPIVAVNEHAADPHYEPSKDNPFEIKRGDLVLLDIFARKHGEESIFADYTFMGYVGDEIPAKINEVFEIVRDARKAAFNFVKDSLEKGSEIFGYQVDDAARNYINERGYGKYFFHRTGHSIGRMVHGNGAHMDNLETRDERKIVDGLCFSIEPGIYLDDFGIRSEIDVYIEGNEAKQSGLPVQEEIVKIV